ncbi:MAG TPA: hypothetical protein VGP41_09330 [Candidatus Lustribacter sp.]|jgi:hypothetical protein|nr:hypothetical protein [Candidatus Lustribacter sp.]
MLVAFHSLRRLMAAVFCMALAVTLMGAETSSLLPAPTVVLFPLGHPEGTDPAAGVAYAAQLGNALKALGGVKVVVADPATAPSDFLHVAKAAGGEYYFMGSIAPPLNNAAAVIEELVSTRSGTIVWSRTAYISRPEDVLDQAPVVKDALLQYADRGYFLVLNPTPKPLPTATPGKGKKGAAPSGGGANAATPPPVARIPSDDAPQKLPNEAYGYSSKPTAPPKIYASASRPSRFVVLNFVPKNVLPAVRDYTIDSLTASLKKHGQTAAEGDPVTTEHRLPGAAVCAETGAAYLVFGDVTAKATVANLDNNEMGHVDASLNVAAYDCVAQRFVPAAKGVRGTGHPWEKAVDAATTKAVNTYLLKLTASAKFS